MQSCTLGSFSVVQGQCYQITVLIYGHLLEITFPKLNSLNFDSKNIKNVAIFLLNQLEIHFQKFQFWLFYSYFN